MYLWGLGCCLAIVQFIMRKILIPAVLLLTSFTTMAQVNWSLNPVGSVFSREGGEMPAGTFRFTSGGYEVFTIVSADKSYQPASLYYGADNVDRQKIDAMVPDGKVPTSMNCFVVHAPGGYLMFDTGLPGSKGGKTIERLASVGIVPSDIKAVYITHGHFDHIGGLLDENGSAVFPEAKIYIPSAELAFIRETMADATSQIETAYSGRLVAFVAGQLLPDDVVPLQAKGHTPGHTAYQLGNLLFVGDIMHGQSIQLIDLTICANFDADREQSVLTRNLILSYAAANSLTVLGAHIPCNGVIF